MRKLLIGLLGAGVLATGGYAAGAGLDDPDPARTVSLPAATTGGGTTTDDTTTGGATTTDESEDLSGPCDEAEHANDPRCTGAAVCTDEDDNDDEADDDSSGRGSGHGGDADEDRSGSNSGRG